MSDRVEVVSAEAVSPHNEDLYEAGKAMTNLFGAGGNDIVEGEKGNDGGTGVDTLLGGGGFDKLYARESPARADKELNCGGEGGAIETRDTVDPAGLGC